MSKTLKITLAVAILLSAVTVSAEDYIDLVKKGNESYRKSEYKDALGHYHAAETELPESPELEYNIAGVLYQQGGYEEAVERFTRALNTTDINVETQAHYNLGGTYYRMGDYQNAIKSYENALNINPDDIDAKFNLELARKMLKEQMQQQEQDPQQQQQQQQQQEQQQKDQPQPQDEQQQEQQQQQQDQQQQQQEEPQPQPQQQDDKKMSKEDAERILNALRDDERDLQKKIKRQVKAGDYTGKDW